MEKTPDEVVRLYENTLYRTALSVTKNREDALDMVQETFIRWMTSRPSFESDEHEKAWLLRVVINLSRNLVSSAAHRTSEELLDIYPAKEEEEKWLLEEVMKLPEKYREVIHLYYYEGYSTAEIAKILDTRESTVRSQMLRARRQLKKALEAEA